MSWRKLQQNLFFNCWQCADTGFVPERRMLVYTNVRKRKQDVKTAIVYRRCRYCATLRWLSKAKEERG